MHPLVVSGATISCPLGTTPATLSTTPPSTVTVGAPAATVADAAPLVNVPPFGMCTTVTNPAVASATSAASGVLTPVPCLPVLTGTWVPGSPSVSLQGRPALTASSTCSCAWGGVITVISPGQTTVAVG